MSDYTLRLFPVDKSGNELKQTPKAADPPPVELPLSQDSKVQGHLLKNVDPKPYVCNDYSYAGAVLKGSAAEAIEEILEFSCNDFGVDVTRRDAEQDAENCLLSFAFGHADREQDDNSSMIFCDFAGYVRFTVKLKLAGEPSSEKMFYTGYIPVYINPKDEQARWSFDAIPKMAEYVFEHCEPFWPKEQIPADDQDRTPSQIHGALRVSNRRQVEAHIRLLENIVKAYERSLPAFRTGSKYRVLPEKQWVSFEQASHLSSDTFHSILQRPYHFIPSERGGITFPGRTGSYLPSKVIAAVGQADYDIYENRYIVSFLKYLQDEITALLQSVRLLQENPPSKKECVYTSENTVPYWNSGYSICGITPRRLETYSRNLVYINSRLFSLYTVYHQLLPTTPALIRGAPQSTAVFRSICHYRNLYKLACQWFQYGVFDFMLQEENMILPFIEGHKLYEYYILVKLLQELRSRGFELQTKREPPSCPDLFVLELENTKATLFFGPRIYNYNTCQRKNPPGLELYYNGTPPYDSDKRHHVLDHYHPDYVIKFQIKGFPRAYYVILDAKFASYYTVRERREKELRHKYLNSLAPYYHLRDVILGVGIPYGKPTFGNEKQTTLEQTKPVTDVPPLMRLIAFRLENEAVHSDALNQALFWPEREANQKEFLR